MAASIATVVRVCPVLAQSHGNRHFPLSVLLLDAEKQTLQHFDPVGLSRGFLDVGVHRLTVGGVDAADALDFAPAPFVVVKTVWASVTHRSCSPVQSPVMYVQDASGSREIMPPKPKKKGEMERVYMRAPTDWLSRIEAWRKKQ